MVNSGNRNLPIERVKAMENELTATYDQDSKRYHRFMIDEGQGLTKDPDRKQGLAYRGGMSGFSWDPLSVNFNFPPPRKGG